MLRIARNLALIALLSLSVFGQTNVNNGGSGGGGGGAVSSVSNSDGTLTISPTTGAVVGSLALGHANTWSGQQTFVAPIFGTPASGVLTNTTGYIWNNLANPGGNLALTMGTNTSTFNFTSNLAAAFGWANTTTASNITTNFSPQTSWLANYWNGASSAVDNWSIYSSLASGTNGATTLNIVHTPGSTGTAQVQVPQLATTGSNGGILMTEGTCSGAPPTSTQDVLCANSTSHTLTVSNNNGTAFTVPLLVASGTSAMGTGAITSGTCATVVTTTATGAATTDNLVANPTADPTGVTGYAPSASGSLYIQAYITSGNANFKVCNNTSGTLTPSALTMQWRVIR